MNTDVPKWARGEGAEPAPPAEPAPLVDRRGNVITEVAPKKSRGRARPARRKRSRRTFVIVATVVLLLAAPVVVGALWYRSQVKGTPGGAAVTVRVERGWSTGRIGDELQRQGVIGSSWVFSTWSKVDTGAPLQAGMYDLRRSMGVSAALAAMRKGPKAPPQFELRLPPGLTIDEIAKRVGKLPGRSAPLFLAAANSGQVRSKYQPSEVKSLEGLTWPDTYFIGETENEATILRRIVAEFDKRADELQIGPRSAAIGVTPYQTVIVASLIQTEVVRDEERPLVAAVVYNRLRDDMMLQIDATLLYARGNRNGEPTNADKAIDSPYNTYKYKGLPPTPISTVTAASLNGALSPAAVPYKFYVLTDKQGRHKFATTIEEHNANVADSRRRGIL